MTVWKLIQAHQGPPVQVERIIRGLGIVLDKTAELDPEISGQIERLEDGRYKISVNRNDQRFRQRFTMAHELGHYLFHAEMIEEGVDDNRAYRSSPDGKFDNPFIGRQEETEANQFAASLLMPTDAVREQWALLNGDPKALARKFQVSETAMRIRLQGLGLLPPA